MRRVSDSVTESESESRSQSWPGMGIRIGIGPQIDVPCQIGAAFNLHLHFDGFINLSGLCDPHNEMR